MNKLAKVIPLVSLIIFTHCGKSSKASEASEAVKGMDRNLEICALGSSIGDKKVADINGDGILQKGEAEKVTRLNCPGANLISLEGIENFKNLNYLNCSGNNISVLPDLAKLPKLQKFLCQNNQFSDRDCDNLEKIKQKFSKDKDSNLDFGKQSDGRVITCTDISFVQKINLVKEKDSTGKMITLPVNDVWGFTQEGNSYVMYGDNKYIHVGILTDDEKSPVKLIHKLDRGEENHSRWGEFRHYKHEVAGQPTKYFIYGGSEGKRDRKSTKDIGSITLYDVTDINKPEKIQIPNDSIGGLGSSHNITVDPNGLLIIIGGRKEVTAQTTTGEEIKYLRGWGGARIYDIKTDPTRPKFLYNTGVIKAQTDKVTKKVNDKDVTYKVNYTDTLYVHDAYVSGKRIYLANGSGSIHWDQNKSDSKLNRMSIHECVTCTTHLGERDNQKEPTLDTLVDWQYDHGYAHNIWADESGEYIVTTGETAVDNQLSFWHFDKAAPAGERIQFINSHSKQGEPMAHNAFIKGNLIYVSHYSKGVSVLEIVADPNSKFKKKMVYRWSYDTYPDHNKPNYNGVWGIYPFSDKSKLFFATDGDYGFHVFKKLKNDDVIFKDAFKPYY